MKSFQANFGNKEIGMQFFSNGKCSLLKMDLKHSLEHCFKETEESCSYYSFHAWFLPCFAAEHNIMMTGGGGCWMDVVLHLWLKEANIISNQSLSELDPITQCMFSVVLHIPTKLENVLIYLGDLCYLSYPNDAKWANIFECTSTSMLKSQHDQRH